jgi:hypothetical protein
MINVNLPRKPDREALLAFWASASLLAGLLVGAVAFLAGVTSAPGSLLLATGAAGVAFLARRSKERALDLTYKRWNKATGAYADWARRTITAIWYWTVFTAVGRTAGGGLRLVDSPWRSRGTLPDRAYGDPGGSTTGRDAVGGIRDFSGWAVRSGRAWTLFLLPMLAILRALDTRGSKSSAPDIYTLY